MNSVVENPRLVNRCKFSIILYYFKNIMQNVAVIHKRGADCGRILYCLYYLS